MLWHRWKGGLGGVSSIAHFIKGSAELKCPQIYSPDRVVVGPFWHCGINLNIFRDPTLCPINKCLITRIHVE